MKPILITEEQKQKALKDFQIYLSKLTKCPDGKINYNAQFTTSKPISNAEKATIIFSKDAYLKIMLYVRDTATEIAWHGRVERINRHQFYIKDVFLYPQIVSGATVDTDQEAYNKWIEELDDDTFNNMRLQGHSHVNFGVSPSGTDRDYYRKMLEVLPNNDYYIFMIINKSGNEFYEIYDLAENTIYETNDINIEIKQDDVDMFKNIDLEKEYFCTRPKRTLYNPSLVTTPDYNTYADWRESDPYTELDKFMDELDQKYNKKIIPPHNKKKGRMKNELK